MKTLLTIAKSKLTCQKGQGTVEYALVTLAVIIIVIAVLGLTGGGGVDTTKGLGKAINDTFTSVTTQIANTV